MDLDLNAADMQIHDGFALDLINSAWPDLHLIILFGISLQMSFLFQNCKLQQLFF